MEVAALQAQMDATHIKDASATSTASQSLPADRVPEKLNLEQLVKELNAGLFVDGWRDDPKVIARITQLMTNYDADDWKRYALWDHSARYTRNLIATDEKTYALMLLCWKPGQTSPIHDHGGSECFLRVIEGQVVEAQFENREYAEGERLCKKFEERHEAGAVAFINDQIGLHSIGNGDDAEPLVTLHCYCPPYDECRAWCSDNAAAADFQECEVHFYSEGGQLVGQDGHG